MIPEGKDVDAVTPEITAEVIRQVLHYRREKDLTLAHIAKGIGVKQSTLSQILSGKYPADGRQKILDLDRWLDDQRRIDLAPKSSNFVWTSVARKIKAMAQTAVELQTIALVYGPETSGLGKTTALEAIAGDMAGCIMITIDKVDATTMGVLRPICQRLRIGYSDRAAYCVARIAEAILGTSRLLIVDQVHNLCGARNDKPFYVLAELHERTKAPQLWAGTSDVNAYLHRRQASGVESLCQVRSRIGARADLTQPRRRNGTGGPGTEGDGQLYTIDEIRAIFGKDKMRLAPDAARYLLRLANLPDSGALRSCRNLIKMAMLLNRDRHDVLTEEMLQSAHRMLMTDESFNLLQAEIEQSANDGPRMAKVG